MEKIVIFGTGDFAEFVYYYFSTSDKYNVVGFTVDRVFASTETFLGLPLIPFDEVEHTFPTDECCIFIAIGYTKVNEVRRKKFLDAKAKGYKFASYISDSAIIASNAQLGDNSFILEGVIIQPFVKIGDAVILWSGCHIGHHSIIADFCFLAPCASLSGYVTLKERSFIGNNAVIRDRINIGKECVIGAGVVILEDVGERSVFKSLINNPLGISSNQLRGI